MPRALNIEPTPDQIASAKLLPYCALRFPMYKISLHNQVVAEYLEAVERHEITRLLLSMPPRHGKTLLLQMFIEWYIGRHQEEQIIYATYNAERAKDVGLAVKTGFSSDEFKYVFRGLYETKTSTARGHISTKTGANLYFIGVNEGSTGRGSNVLIIDDPLKGETDAMSDAVIRQLRTWYTAEAYTRQQPKFAIIVCHTRWTTEDLIGWLQKEHKHEQWVELRMPAIAEAGDLLGRKVGEPLWPEHYSKPRLEQMKLSMKSLRRWNAIYQQRPVPEEGAIIQTAWFGKYYRWDSQFVYFGNPAGEIIKERIIKIVQSWDTAYKKEEINDPSVCLTWAVLRNGYALIDAFSRRMEYPELKKSIVNLYDEYGPSAVLIEDRSSGQSLVQEFKFTRIPVIPVGVTKDKVIRLRECSDLIESGKVHLPAGIKPWVEDYVDELTTFPYGGLDDQVDATSLFLNWIKKRTRYKRSGRKKYYK